MLKLGTAEGGGTEVTAVYCLYTADLVKEDVGKEYISRACPRLTFVARGERIVWLSRDEYSEMASSRRPCRYPSVSSEVRRLFQELESRQKAD
jgi:hypothetical protein